MSEYSPENDPDDYAVGPEEAGGPNDGPQDAEVPEVTDAEVEAENA